MFGIGIGVVTRGGALWADGARIRDLFGGPRAIDTGPTGATTAASTLAVLPPPSDPPLSPELLDGPHGTVLRQAADDRRGALDLIARLSETERRVIPDVKDTVESLYDRIVGLAGALHRVESEANGDRLPSLDARIASVESEPGTLQDRERRLSLLKRQRDTVAGLLESRGRLAEQYESAGLVLRNLTLDLLKIRSAGLDSAMSDIASATQEARALSREIGYALGAAKELEGL